MPSSPRTPLDRLHPLLVLALVGLGAAIRLTGASPLIAARDPAGLLKSDPALIYYITERIVENGGAPPRDFRADPRIESPELTDIPAMFTVGEEFLVAWSYLLLGIDAPLHVFANVLMSLIASLTVVGIVGLAREVTGSRPWAALAGLLFVTTAGSYRTLGYILVREDLSVPLFALHLYLLARAVRVATLRGALLAALAAAASLATWHAMRFVFSIEVACAFAWWLRTARNPMGGTPGRVALVSLAVAAVLVPVLRSKAFLVSWPMQMLVVMAIAPWLVHRLGHGTWTRVPLALALLALLAAVSGVAVSWLEPGGGDYSHVVDMMIAKIRYLGVPPADPNELPYEVRLLWQGIFASRPPHELLPLLGAPAVLAPVAAFASLRSWWEGSGDGRQATLAAFGAAGLILAILVGRLVTLAGMLSPVLAVVALRSIPRDRARSAWIAATLAVHLLVFPSVMRQFLDDPWYAPERVAQLRGTLDFIRRMPADGSVAADYVTSAAVLAQTDHPIVLQPKYETTRSRRRIQRFTLALYHETPQRFREILRREFGARYLLIDKPLLWGIRYEAGLRRDAQAPPKTSAAAVLLHNDPRVYGHIPGYRLVYLSPGRMSYRLYDLEGGPGDPQRPAHGAPAHSSSATPNRVPGRSGGPPKIGVTSR